MTKIRLNKHLAELGICSRRAADKLIEAGKVSVDGRVAEVGQTVDPETQQVEVEQETLKKEAEKLVYYALNKPAGITTACVPTTADPDIVTDLVPKSPRVFPVGRLDKDTTGLLILTNDGVLAYRLTHPSFDCEKEYEAILAAPLTAERVRKIQAGVRLERSATKPVELHQLESKKARVILTEGKNRQVRKIFGKVGCEVLKLKRVRIKQLTLDRIALGKWRELTAKEVEMLRKVD